MVLYVVHIVKENDFNVPKNIHIYVKNAEQLGKLFWFKEDENVLMCICTFKCLWEILFLQHFQ